MARPLVGVVAALAFAGPAAGQAVTAEWFPGAPAQGQFAYVVVAVPPSVRAVGGVLERNPLMFEPRADRHVALAAVRLAAADSVPLVLWLDRTDGGVDTLRTVLPVRRQDFPTERLTVASHFAAEPDSALRERIRREARMVEGVYRKAQATPRLWAGPFVAPRDSRITSPFGRGRIFNGEVRSRHWGTDYDGVVGDPVRAANGGVVELVGDLYYAGTVVYVNHGGGLVTGYMHLSESLVAVGDTVTAGSLLGRVGQTGRVTGPHLHWSVRFGHATVDGVSLLTLPPLPAERALE